METIIGLIIAVSIASERLVEIIKELVPFLADKQQDVVLERRRCAMLQGLAILAGMLTASLAMPSISPPLPPGFQGTIGIMGLGLLASGGSGLWNSILTYVLKVKDIKAIQATASSRELSLHTNPPLQLDQARLARRQDPEVG